MEIRGEINMNVLGIFISNCLNYAIPAEEICSQAAWQLNTFSKSYDT